MIKLYQFHRAFGLPNPSPFCMKTECALRMARLEYEIIPCSNPAKAPKGKLPFIEDGEIRMGDSELILDFLRVRYGFDPDRDLSAEQMAVSRAFQALLDDRLYWAVIQNRWFDERNWPLLREAFFGEFPVPLRWFVPELARRGLRRQLQSHGLGRHSPEEIDAFGVADLRAVAAYLGDKPYFHGGHPTRIDACLLAYVANILDAPFESRLREEAQHHSNLVAYRERMMHAYFSDFL